jgi:hypothetical protein
MTAAARSLMRGRRGRPWSICPPALIPRIGSLGFSTGSRLMTAMAGVSSICSSPTATTFRHCCYGAGLPRACSSRRTASTWTVTQPRRRRPGRARRGIWSQAGFHPIAAKRIGRVAQGYRVVTGTVSSARCRRTGVWLRLDGVLGVKIGQEDLGYFKGRELCRLRGRQVSVRGMVRSYRGSSRMRLRHPLYLDAGDGSGAAATGPGPR